MLVTLSIIAAMERSHMRFAYWLVRPGIWVDPNVRLASSKRNQFGPEDLMVDCRELGNASDPCTDPLPRMLHAHLKLTQDWNSLQVGETLGELCRRSTLTTLCLHVVIDGPQEREPTWSDWQSCFVGVLLVLHPILIKRSESGHGIKHSILFVKSPMA